MSHSAEAKDDRRWVVPHEAFHRALTASAGRRVNDLLGRLFDHSERYRRLHIGPGPSAWATAGHREILDAAKLGDRDLSAARVDSHLARTGLEVIELLEPGYDPGQPRTALIDAGGKVPAKPKRARQG